jgi:hypothetical protein
MIRLCGWFVFAVAALATVATLLAWRFGDESWRALWTGYGTVKLPGYDFGAAAGAQGGSFATAGLTFAGAAAAATLGGLGVALGWRKLGGALLVVALGVTVSLSSHLVPPVFYPMVPVGLLGLVSFFTAPKVLAPAAPAELERVRAAVAGLTRGGPLKFALGNAFLVNFALGLVVLLPGLLFWQRAKGYVQELDGAGVLTRGGLRLGWESLARVHKRTFRRRGWNIGHRMIELDFTTGTATLEEGALVGPFDQVWDAL